MSMVYVIESAGAVKVGVSTNPSLRLAALQSGTHLPLSLSHVEAHQNPFLIERMAHALLGPHRLGGEWFSVTAHEARQAVADACGMADRGEIGILPKRKARKSQASQSLTYEQFYQSECEKFGQVAVDATLYKWRDAVRPAPPVHDPETDEVTGK